MNQLDNAARIRRSALAEKFLRSILRRDRDVVIDSAVSMAFRLADKFIEWEKSSA